MPAGSEWLLFQLNLQGAPLAVVAPFHIALNDSISGEPTGPELAKYEPGQAFRIAATVTQLGILADPPNPMVATIHWPDGTTATPTVVHPSAGSFYADVEVPFGLTTTVASYRWQTTGATAEEHALAERRFIIDPLDF